MLIIKGAIYKCGDELRSYNIIVCTLRGKDVILDPDITYTQTTTRHLKEFLRQHDYPEDVIARVVKAAKEF